ncbi:MAG: S8 family serine peptidase [Anaerolineae bacterium]|nr:S8 family serine peptidase [Anaerolineae bacterium]
MMVSHPIRNLIAVVSLLALLFSGLAINWATAQVPDAGDKIEPLLAEAFDDGAADFIVRFVEQADLTPAYYLDWAARGDFVYDTLRETAERSQTRAIAYLEQAGLEYESFIAGNELYVWAGDLAAANELAALPEVDAIRAPRTFALDPIVPGPSTVEPQALAWGITDTGADQFWTAYGQGEGIIVAGIDTGVQWDHPALDQSFHCPGDPSNAACWSDPENWCGGSACDNNGHGTHTMGTMVADDDPSLTWQAGMAPNATWIACKGCGTSSCSEYALNACADWLLAPAGNPANRPHVVNNSWGGGGGSTWYQGKVQAWRAAGIFPAFSAGNSGSGCGTLGSPGDYQESFATAAHDSSRNIASFSSRGPSDFGHDPYTKPNISSPGVSVCSTVPGSGWSCGYSGTSMASPHTAGAVALLWACNSSLVGQIDTTFQALQSTTDAAPAGNCGAPPDGEGNYTYGYGYLNIYAAGQSYCNVTPPETGTIEGYVYDLHGGSPIVGATLTTSPGGYSTPTDSSGHYALTIPVGTYDVTASNSGYASKTAPDISVLANATVQQNFYLDYSWLAGAEDPFDLTRYDCTWFDDGSGSSTYNQKVYCLGGRSGASESPDIWRFDPVNGTWTDTGHNMIEDVSNYTANVVNDWIYVVSGYDAETSSYVTLVQRYQPSSGTVENVSTDPWPMTVSGTTAIPGACAAVQNKIYCFGGWQSSASPYFSSQTWEYDPARAAGSRWQQINTANLGQARGYIQAAVYGNVIYAMGGIYQYDPGTPDLVPSTVVEALDVNNLGAGWQSRASLPVASAEGRGFGSGADTLGGVQEVWDGKIYIAGGGDWPNQTAEAMEYDIATNTWDQSFPDLTTARRDHAGTFITLCTADPDDGLPGLWVFGGRYSDNDDPPYASPEYHPFPCGGTTYPNQVYLPVVERSP